MQENLINSHQMLGMIISKLGLRNVPDLPMYDIISWMGEALSHIASYPSLETTTATVNITNYIGKWPRDLYAPIRVENHPRFRSIRGGFQIELCDGEVNIEYERFPVDDDGYPMFPGDPSTKEAVMWYCAQYLAIQGIVSLDPEYCSRKWQWYCGQARAEGYAPTIDQWERMVNVFYRLIPMKDEYANHFEGLNAPERLELDKLNRSVYGG